MTDPGPQAAEAARQRHGEALRGPGVAGAPATRPVPGAKLAFKRHLVEALIVFVLACLAGVGWLSYQNRHAATESERWETHTRVVIQELGDLLSSLKDAETGQRGFIITGKPDYLEPYHASLDVLPTRLAGLRRLTADNPHQQQRLAAITPLVEAKLALLKESIVLRQPKDFPAAREAVMTESGKEMMDHIRMLVAEAQDEERQLLKERIATRQRDTRKTTQLVLLGNTLGGLVLLLLLIYLRWELASRRRADTALQASEERLRLAAEAAHFGMYDRDLGGAYFHVSAQIKQMLGYAHDALLDHPQIISHIHPEDRLAGVAAFERACDPAGDGHIAIEQRIVQRDGAVRWISTVGRVLFEDGVPRRSLGFWIDITERSRLERATLAQAHDLVELDRRKDEFLAMLSHELRNPLAALSSAVQLLRLQKNEDPLQQQSRGIIERQVGHLRRLVDDLLEVSRITSGRVQLRQERISLGGVVERAVETAQPLVVQRRHELTVSLPPQPVFLQADAARLEQVLVNLLTNAAKYTDEGGRIWLSVEHENEAEAKTAAKASVALQVPVVVIRVRDSGIGIAPELLPHVFDLFTQAERSIDRSQGGLGIGLCLVQRLVQLHGGTVKAFSVLGEGSEFVVRLPVMMPVLPALLPPAAEPVQSPAKGCRVLAVDDNVDAVQALAMLLTMSGHEVQLAYDGPSAVEAALAMRPDVVLLDIGLPGLTGYEVAGQIRQEATLRNIVLVALTGYGRETDRQRSQDAGFDYHLVKPADFREVEKILAVVATQAA